MKAKEMFTQALGTLSHLTQSEMAYIAGIIDGEGSIGIYEITSYPVKGGNKYTNLIPRMTINNTDPALFDWLLPRITGSRLYRKAGIRTATRKTCGMMVCDGCRAAALCKVCLPYLIIKKRKAEIVIEFYEKNETGGRGLPLDAKEKERRGLLLDEFKKELVKGSDHPVARWPVHTRMEKSDYIV